MSATEMQRETPDRTLAPAREDDERYAEYWSRLIAPSGWMVHMSDDVIPGRKLPYAIVVLEVEYVHGSGYFISGGDDTDAPLEYPVIVFADEITSATRPTPSNRQSDGNTYIYNLYALEHMIRDDEQDFNSLPSGRYRLEIMVPLFHLEMVVARWNCEKGYKVSTSEFLYDYEELEENNGPMGLWATDTFPSREFVWKLSRKATNLHSFELEMHRRVWGWNTGGNNVQLQSAERHGSESSGTMDHLDADSEDDTVMVKVEPGSESPRTLAGSDAVSDPVEESETPMEPNSRKRKYSEFVSRHDPDALWVHRPGKMKMKY